MAVGRNEREGEQGWRAGEGEERFVVIFDLERQRGRKSELLIEVEREKAQEGKRERERGWGTSKIALIFLFISKQPRTFHVSREIIFGKIIGTRSSSLKINLCSTGF